MNSMCEERTFQDRGNSLIACVPQESWRTNVKERLNLASLDTMRIRENYTRLMKSENTLHFSIPRFLNCSSSFEQRCPLTRSSPSLCVKQTSLGQMVGRRARLRERLASTQTRLLP